MSNLALDPMTPKAYRIQRVQKDTHDTFTLYLAATQGGNAIRFRPGQFNMLYVHGVGEIPVSISGNPFASETLIHTTRKVGAVTKALGELKVGNVVGVRGPFGSSWPVAEAEGRDVVIVAGGIGLAPLRPAIYHILENRGKYGRLVLLYGARTPKDVLYQKELSQWRSRFDMEVHVTVDRATDRWRGHVGVVTSLIGTAPFDPYKTVAMVCGPEIMMEFVVQTLQKRGVDEDSIYLSMERNMKCAIGLCGHCQWGSKFVCKDGPVFRYDQIQELFLTREI